MTKLVPVEAKKLALRLERHARLIEQDFSKSDLWADLVAARDMARALSAAPDPVGGGMGRHPGKDALPRAGTHLTERVAGGEGSALDLEAIRGRAAAATPGPWYADYGWRTPDATVRATNSHGDTDVCVAADYPGFKDFKANAAFIAHARTDVPALCDEVERRVERERALVAALVGAKRELWRRDRQTFNAADFKNFALIQEIDAALDASRAALTNKDPQHD